MVEEKNVSLERGSLIEEKRLQSEIISEFQERTQKLTNIVRRLVSSTLH